MAKSKRPRPITLTDTAATTGRILNPVGTYVSNPSTALYGQQGQYGSGLPAGSGFGGNLGGGLYDPLNPNANNPLFHPNDMTGQMAVSGSSAPVMYNPIMHQTLASRFPKGMIGSGMTYPQMTQRQILNATNGGTNAGIGNTGGAWGGGGYIPPSFNWQTDGNLLPPPVGGQGQGQGNIVNSQNINGQEILVGDKGVRYDTQGNEVWNPETATKDIYGGNFVQEGAKKWVRGADGRVRRAVARNGRWEVKRGGAGGHQGGRGGEATQTNSGSTHSYGLVTFNTGSG